LDHRVTCSAWSGVYSNAQFERFVGTMTNLEAGHQIQQIKRHIVRGWNAARSNGSQVRRWYESPARASAILQISTMSLPAFGCGSPLTTTYASPIVSTWPQTLVIQSNRFTWTGKAVIWTLSHLRDKTP